MTLGEFNSWNDIILGEGTIWPIPPDLSSCGRDTNIDWDGEVCCRSDVDVGGFDAANVQVKVSFSMNCQSIRYIIAIL